MYVCAAPAEKMPAAEQARRIFSEIQRVIQGENACVLQERIYAVKEAVEKVCQVRSKVYGNLDDGVPPGRLVCKEGMSGEIACVQVHAVSSDSRPEVIDLEGRACGRILRLPSHTYITLSGVSAPDYSKPIEQAHAMLEKTESILKQFGGDVVCFHYDSFY